MRQRPLWTISVATSTEAEDAIADLLTRAFSQPAVSYTNAETRATAVTVYLRERPDWSRARQKSLAREIQRIASAGLTVGSGKLVIRKLGPQDWAQSWKRHFKPMTIGSKLLIRPGWSRRRPSPGQSVVVLDPGLSFGTGQHPTTAFCLRQLALRRHSDELQSFLDIGTGSGILAIAAAKLGYRPVVAFDNDQDAVCIARSNARRNRVARQIRFFQRDLTRSPGRPPKRFSLICANLVANLLLASRESILASLRPEGVLVLAGVLKAEFPRLLRVYQVAGLRLLSARTQNEWRSGAFAWRQPAGSTRRAAP